MRQRIMLFFLLSVLYSIFTCSMPDLVQATAEWNAVSTLSLDKSPIDIFTSSDDKLAYILMPGEVQIYSLNTKNLQERIPVDKDINRLSVSPRGNLIYLINGKTNTLSVFSLALVQNIDVKGSPFKGPADAPVVIVDFSNYQ